MEDMTDVAVRRNFLWMTVCFAVNHGCATTPLIYASSVLDAHVGFLGNGVLYTLSIVSSLLLSVIAIDTVGLKGGLLLGTCLYGVYVGSFALAATFSEVMFMQYALYVGGSAAGGLAAGILWTAEGGYMAQSATLLADQAGMTRPEATAELAGEFAFYYLIFEVISKLAFSFLQGTGWQVAHIGILYTIIALIAMLLLTGTQNLTHGSKGTRELKGEYAKVDVEKKSPLSKLFATTRLWSDPKIWLLSPTNITFGFSAAYLNGYFNAHYEAPELGAKQLGILCAITVACAAVLSKVYGRLGQAFGKGVPIFAGAMSFACIPILILTTHCCEDWGWSMVVFYILQGSGRAVYESTNKAVFSDFFTGEDTEGAFANCSMQMSVASAVLFFNSGKITGQQLATMVMISAVATPVVYVASSMMKKHAVLPVNDLDSLESPKE
jgi:MFS family permease